MLSKLSIGSESIIGFQFHNTTAAYVATGGSSRCPHADKKGSDIGGGIVSAGESPPQTYPCVMNPRMEYARLHSDSSRKKSVCSMGSLSTTLRIRFVRMRGWRFAITLSHGA